MSEHRFRNMMWCLTALLLLVMLLLWPAQRLKIQLSPYVSESCQLGSAQSSVSLNILGAAVVLQPILPALCQYPPLASVAEQITINWPDVKTLTANDLIEGHYQLIWSRPELLKAVLHNFDHYYQPLWLYPDYPVYWISAQPITALNREFLLSQHIGLLSDQSSYSGYQLPLASLQKAGLSLSEVRHSFYADRSSLALAAAKGEISLYPSVLLAGDGKLAETDDSADLFDITGKAVAAAQRFQMAGSSNGGAFYLHRSWQQHACLLQQLLGSAIASSMVHQVALPCHN